ncbi:MAG: cytochrome hydroxylase [Amycolatopsis sp.]|jgi:pentalenic acid synthase|uniref:cytochrome P450 n=1 Tax=Amycolatopsis sp. TaxID=37632 RepID=UPI00260DABC8|nr:cytochrome P450 [Amycolatopsis sp.]MCU1682652.1 cytochrome hydroxylase [Amycolatopsis sp.]
MTDTIPAITVGRTCPFDPPDGSAELRERGPVARVRLFGGHTAWLVTGHAEARALLADPRVSSDQSKPNYPVLQPTHTRLTDLDTTVVFNDPPKHTRLRRMLISSFTVRKIAALRPKIERIVTERLDAMIAAGPPADLLASFALPVPSMVICELLGVPYEDHEFFEEQSRHRRDPDGQALQNLVTYLRDLVQKKIYKPGDGLLDDLIAEQVAEGKLDHDELAMMGMAMLVAGHDTTGHMISLGTMLLLSKPDQLAKVRADQAVIPGAVEELLRYLTIATFLPRTATEDIELGGHTIKAGDGVVVASSIVNREHSDELDVDNSMRQHLAFGFGIHQCLGQNLARAELEIAFRHLFHRIPTLRLAVPVDEVSRRPEAVLSGVTELPVDW